MNATRNTSYAGDIEARDSWARLAAEQGAQLVDVRTEAEWSYVGIPDLGELGRQTVLCEWQSFPDLAVNPAFSAELEARLAEAGYRKGASLFFLCRSGARSRAAAIAMTAAGHGPCFNIKDGFEGPLDQDRHRGLAAGWKAGGLPWMQS